MKEERCKVLHQRASKETSPFPPTTKKEKKMDLVLRDLSDELLQSPKRFQRVRDEAGGGRETEVEKK